MGLAWEEGDHTEDLNVDNSTILKLILKEWDARGRRELCVQNIDHYSPLSKGNKPTDFVKYKACLTHCTHTSIVWVYISESLHVISYLDVS